MTRREWLWTGVASGIGALLTGANARAQARPAAAAVDHLLLGAADLDEGVNWFESLTGVRAVAGGSHPGGGTRNALASLGGRRYLEIIAPDPEQATYQFHLDVRALAEPRVITWAADTQDIEALARRAAEVGHKLFGPASGSRERPDGVTLRWRTAGVLTRLGTGPIEPLPFFIAWAPESRHPSSDAPGGCALERLTFQHSDPSRLQDALGALGIDAVVIRGPEPRLVATLKTPRGTVELS